MKLALLRLVVGISMLGGAARAAPEAPLLLPTVQALAGDWKLAPDPGNVGREQRWFAVIRPDAQPAPVPGIIQEVLPRYHGAAWYWREFSVSPHANAAGRVVVHFGAVDYLAEVWLNGTRVGAFEGGETPFEFDVTELIKPAAPNLLAVRVLNPTNDPIDGITLKETPHRNKAVDPTPGSSYDSGGIMYPVQLRFLPPLYISDVFARPDWQTGEISLTVAVRNSTNAPVDGQLEFNVEPATAGDELVAGQIMERFPAGISQHELKLKIVRPHPWQLDDPYLYRVTTAVERPGQAPHRMAVRCGFRDFRVRDGWFYLNGKRLFLKSTHTGNLMPIGQQLPPEPDFVRRDLINAKAAGFNTVRFIAGVPYPEQLDFCDEIGLLVYEECFASWLLGDSPRMAERFDRNTAAMIHRDRNHPSVAIWGLLNETGDGPVFRHAVTFLPELRRSDPTRLVILSSGRWDGDWSIGSVSNPFGSSWEPVWGTQAAGAVPVNAHQSPPGYVDHSGDAHVYPPVPTPPAAQALVRHLGTGTKPVLLSEFGTGSMYDVIGERRHFEQVGARTDLADYASLIHQSDAFAADWQRLGFGDVYPFPEDLLRESERLNARQRSAAFDLIRSNPQLCGFNLTGMLDHAMTGEGLWTFWREWKPAVFDAVRDGWGPLRWCLFVSTLHGYVGQSIEIEAVLANEDVLAPGEYPAHLRILGPTGRVWEKEVVVRVANSRPLATPVLKTSLVIDGPPGEYILAAALDRGGAASGGRLQFHLSRAASRHEISARAAVWGLEAPAIQWLTARGLEISPLTLASPPDLPLILVGTPRELANAPLWAALKSRLIAGATVIFLSADPFVDHPAAMAWLPLQHSGRCYAFNDWLYHKECVSRRTPVWEGLDSPGLMDPDYYGAVIPHEVFAGIDPPDETIAAAFATGHHALPGGYGSSILIGQWQAGRGHLILNTTHLLPNLGTQPAADRLLINLVRYAAALPVSPSAISR